MQFWSHLVDKQHWFELAHCFRRRRASADAQTVAIAHKRPKQQKKTLGYAQTPDFGTHVLLFSGPRWVQQVSLLTMLSQCMFLQILTFSWTGRRSRRVTQLAGFRRSRLVFSRFGVDLSQKLAEFSAPRLVFCR